MSGAASTPSLGSSVPILLTIPSAALEEIQSCAKKAYPHECCGVLLGTLRFSTGIRITRVRGTRNAERKRGRDRFVIDPRDMRELDKELHALGRDEQMVGFFHSHPDAPARPSAMDLECARGVFEVAREFFIYLIAGVDTNGVNDTTCWRLNAKLDGFDAVPFTSSPSQ